jgi:hypothetical protein
MTNLLIRLLRFLFPPHRMAGCTPLRDEERLAEYERRLGEHKAQRRLREARVSQLLDEKTVIRPKITPKLPADRNVVQFPQPRAKRKA